MSRAKKADLKKPKESPVPVNDMDANKVCSTYTTAPILPTFTSTTL
jgi:hypothetical protein